MCRSAAARCRAIRTARSIASGCPSNSPMQTPRGNQARPESPLTEIRHTAIATWPVLDDCIQIGGVTLTRLAERVGRTPFYAYDRARIKERVEHVRRHIPEAVRLHYA